MMLSEMTGCDSQLWRENCLSISMTFCVQPEENENEE